MIFIVDAMYHFEITSNILKDFNIPDVGHILLVENSNFNEMYKIIDDLKLIVSEDDIVLLPWATSSNEQLDNKVSELGKLCFVVVAAGNSGKEIEYFSPAKANNVIAVGALNKKGERAGLSNFSFVKEIVWIPGTNYKINDTLFSGTSVSSAVYCALLAKAISKKSLDILPTLISQYTEEIVKGSY